jgi:hypothetical protein
LRSVLIERGLDPQIGYQQVTRQRALRGQRVAVPVTIGLFGVSLLAAVLHVSPWFGDHRDLFAYSSIVAPTIAAAVGGYVGQREYVRRARRASAATATLRRARRDIERAADGAEVLRILELLQPELAAEAQDWSTSTIVHDLEVP